MKSQYTVLCDKSQIQIQNSFSQEPACNHNINLNINQFSIVLSLGCTMHTVSIYLYDHKQNTWQLHLTILNNMVFSIPYYD